MLKVFTGFLYIYMALLWIFAGLMHLWTVYIAYSFSGWFWGLVTLFFPVISQIVWGFRAWMVAGFDSPYLQWVIVLALMWIGHYILAFIGALLERNQERKNYYDV